MAKDRELPPPLEMMCLNALWEIGEGNVEEVRKVVSQNRPLAYTTVLTLLDRLARRAPFRAARKAAASAISPRWSATSCAAWRWCSSWNITSTARRRS